MKLTRSIGSFAFLVFFGLHVGRPQQASANGLDEWTQRDSHTTVDLLAVAFGNGLFVAVGPGGTMLRSTTGATWSLVNSPTELTLEGIAFGAGKFVAVGNGGVIITSSNGVDWNRQIFGTAGELIGITYGGGRFVVVGRGDTGAGYEGVILTSTDGVGWIRRDSGVRDPLHAVTYGAGKYVVVGHLGAVTSSDGITWQRVPVPNYGPIYGIAYGNNRFVTAQSDIYTPTLPFSVSEDGQNWHDTSAETDGVAWSITFASGVFVAVGGLNLHFGNPTNQVCVSADGEHWTTYPAGLLPDLRGIAYGADRFVAVGMGGTIVQSGVTVQPTLTIVRHAGQSLVLVTVSGGSGTYRLQTTTNLGGGDWSDWMTITNPVPSVTVPDNTVTNLNQRYYRLISP